nr:unnamed protein product [Haemonchus contortus]
MKQIRSTHLLINPFIIALEENRGFPSPSMNHEAVEPRVKTSHEAVQARVKKKVEEKVMDPHPPPEIRPLPESPKEVLYTARKFTSSFVDEPLRIQRTQHASDESIHDKFEQNQARRIRTEDDGTYLDAPSLQRADTSVDSDLGSLRDAVKELVNIRDNISKRQTTSGESIIGDHSREKEAESLQCPRTPRISGIIAFTQMHSTACGMFLYNQVSVKELTLQFVHLFNACMCLQSINENYCVNHVVSKKISGVAVQEE